MDNLTPTEAQLVLVALDVLIGYGWDGAPYEDVVGSAIIKLEELAGDFDANSLFGPRLRVIE